MSDFRGQGQRQSLQEGLSESRLNLWMSSTSLVFSIFALVLLARQGEHQTAPSQGGNDFQSSNSIQGDLTDGKDTGRSLMREMSDLYGARLYPSHSRHGYLYDIKETENVPAAVVYGDLILINGKVITKSSEEDEGRSTKAVSALTDPETGTWENMKDTFMGGEGRCGIRYLDENTVQYTMCTSCSLRRFETERALCCNEPHRCQSMTNRTCSKYGRSHQKALCLSSGCTGLSHYANINAGTRSMCISGAPTANWRTKTQRQVECGPTVCPFFSLPSLSRYRSE